MLRSISRGLSTAASSAAPPRASTTSAAASSSSPSLRPLPDGPTHFGREVLDADLSDPSISMPSSSSPAESLVSALYEHGLLLFRGQGHLTPDDEMRLARLFTHHPDDIGGGGQSYTGGAGTQHRLPSYPSVALVGSYSVKDYYGLTASSPGVYGDWHPDQRAWHCDGLADTDPPPDLTTMRCLKTPRGGEGRGETLFASSVRAAELLPPALDPNPENVRMNYRLFDEYEIARDGTHLVSAEGAKGSTDAADEVNLGGGTSVPLVIREPVSGKRSLVGTYHVASLNLLDDPPDAPPLLDFDEANEYAAKAWGPGLSDEWIYRHCWSVGDVAVWSNRLVIHTATSTASYAGEERLHTRIRMRSEEEYAPRPWRGSSESEGSGV